MVSIRFILIVSFFAWTINFINVAVLKKTLFLIVFHIWNDKQVFPSFPVIVVMKFSTYILLHNPSFFFNGFMEKFLKPLWSNFDPTRLKVSRVFKK
jgi:hypothetical protein